MSKSPDALIQKKETIQQNLEELTFLDKKKLFQKLKDTFYVYGFKVEEVKDFLDGTADIENYSTRRLSDLEGVANAILFELKYKQHRFQ